MNLILKLLLAVGLALTTNLVLASSHEDHSNDGAKSSAQKTSTVAEELAKEAKADPLPPESPAVAKIRAKLKDRIPDITIISITPVNALGMYEVITDDYTTIYADSGADNFIIGDHYSTGSGRLKNVSRGKREKAQFAQVEKIPLDEMIIFPATNEKGEEVKTDKWVVVFTDIDCGYCRKLHREIEQVNRLGIEVRYAFFPRSGVGKSSYDKAVSVWCSEDKQASMTAAKFGLPLKEATCENPVAEQLNLGRQVGVRGTPTMWTSTGVKIGGYVPADRLLRGFQQG